MEKQEKKARRVRRSKEFYDRIKPQVIKELMQNGLDYKAVSVEHGIKVDVVRRWWKDWNIREENSDILAASNVSATIAINRMRMEFAGEMYNELKALAHQLVERASYLVQYESDLDKISRASKIVTEMTSVLFKEDKDRDQIDSNIQKITLIEQSIVQLNASDNAPTPSPLLPTAQ